MKTLTEIKTWLATFPDQCLGLPKGESNTGEPYHELMVKAPYRADDLVGETLAKETVCEMFFANLHSYLKSRTGTIYWRIPIEEDTQYKFVVLRYDPEGPDKDFITDQRCHLDKNWRMYVLYCRVLRSDRPIVPPPNAEAFHAMKVLDRDR